MSSFKEQLNKIQDIRNQREISDEQLYFTQLKLQKIQNLLDKATRNEAQYNVNDAKEIAGLRSQILVLETQLQVLNQNLGNLGDLSQKIIDIENYIEFLKKKIAVIQSQVDSINKEILSLQNPANTDIQKINDLKKNLTDLNGQLDELKRSLDKAQADRNNLLKQNRVTSGEKDKVNSQKNSVLSEIDKLEKQVVLLLYNGNVQGNNGNLTGELASLKAQYENNKNALAASGANLYKEIGSLYVNEHPKYALKELRDNIPFLLLPVRIETRFMTEGRTQELWVRIYPDDIAVHTHEKVLTDKEVVEGKKYWSALFNAEKEGGTGKEDKKKAAWNNIVALFGPQRSAWVAGQTKPTNWAAIDSISNANDLIFPAHDNTKTNAWSRAPRTQVMPDKFVVMLYDGDKIVYEKVGNLIPDILYVGPDPLEADSSFTNKDGKLLFGGDFDWTSDFEKAVQFGMGVKISLSAPYISKGFDKVLVLGLYLSSDESQSKTVLEGLIDNHHYSLKGFSLLTQGAPTNNTEKDGSGYTKNDSFNDISYFVETGKPIFDPNVTDDANCDGKRLAESLGIEYAPLQYILNSNSKDFEEAAAMNTALFPGTLGYYIDSLMSPVFDDTVKDAIKDYFKKHVTGRGPLSAIRVGNQPYGFLVTSDFSKWEWQQRRESAYSSAYGYNFLNTLTNVLRHYQDIWDGLIPQLMYVGKPGTDSSEVLMNILGLQPNSASFYQRAGYSSDYLRNLDDFQWGGTYFGDLLGTVFKSIYLLSFLEKFNYQKTDSSGKIKEIPQLFKLIYQHYNTRLDSSNLIDNVPLSEKDKIKNYDESKKKNYISWLFDTSNVDTLERQDFGGAPVPNALLYLQLRHALLLQLHKTSAKWLINRNIHVESSLMANNFYNIRPQADITKWEVMKAKVQLAEPSSTYKDLSVADYFLTSGLFEDDAAYLNEMKTALRKLADLPTARLERCFTEHMDICTYRLDSWQTSIFDLRLQEQRNTAGENAQQRKKGIYLGAYGWLENLRPVNKTLVDTATVPPELRPAENKPLYEYNNNGGFVQAPSLNHASAAALLRSGYMSHATKDDPDLMAVNLSSARVQRALYILEGMRNNQTLEALLGYQFERGLHDRSSKDTSLNLNQYIYNFRDTFPIKQNKIHQQGSDGTSEESLPANNVVNGIALAETKTPYPYGVSGLDGATAGEIDGMKQERDSISDTLDAVKDLMLAESAYQLVQSNFDRAGAVMNALKDSHIPPELDVINTPRSTSFTFTNRVTVHFENLDPAVDANNPWHGILMTQRAQIETGLNKWLGSIIGLPGNIVCRVAHLDKDKNEIGSAVVGLDKLNIQPIDFIYLIGTELGGGATELESRIAYYYRQANALDDSVLLSIKFTEPVNPPGKKTFGVLLPLAKMLKSMITDSRYLHAQDFMPPSKQGIVNPDNPKGYDASNLLSRIQNSQVLLKNYIDELNSISINSTINLSIVNNLKDAFDKLNAAKLGFPDITFTFSAASSNQLRNVLVKIANFGVQDAFPKSASGVTNEEKVVLLEQAHGIAKIIDSMYKNSLKIINDASGITLTEKKVNEYIKAGKGLFGDVFNIIPLFNYSNEADIQLSNNDRTQLLKFAANNLNMQFPADEWMYGVSHVRQKLSKWESLRTLNEIFNSSSLEIKPVQLPYRAKDNWLAVEFPEKDELTGKPFGIVHDTISVVAHGASAFTPGAKQSGILIDDWTEIIPNNEEITGITFNYNQPNSFPPQSLLLAVTPKETGSWDWDNLVGILNDTLQRAKRRAVEPLLLDKADYPELSTLLPAIIAEFSQYDLNVSLDYRLNISFIADAVANFKMK